MSMVPSGPTDLQQQGDLIDGLEDFDPSDLGVPVIRIDGKLKPRPWLAEGQTGPAFVDSLSGQEWRALEGIVVLGLVKGRVLWPAQMGETKESPMCRSYDSKIGFPTDGKFPWGAVSAFDRDALKIGEKEGEEPGSIVTLYQAPCDHCSLKEWGTHPAKDAPWCTLQHSYPILIPTGDVWVPSILVLQRSSIKPSNNYVGGFHRAKQPMYTVLTNITLDPRTKGQTDYAVPVLKRGAATVPDDYAFFSQKFRDIAEYLRTPRGFEDAAEEDEAEVGVTINPTAPAHPQAAAQPTQAPPTPSAPPAAPPTPAPTPPPTPTPSETADASSPAATAPATPPAAETAAPSEAPAPAQPPAPPQPVLAPDGVTWIMPVWNGSTWEFPTPETPAEPPAPSAPPAAAMPAMPSVPPAAPPAATQPPATPAPAAGTVDDDDEVPF